MDFIKNFTHVFRRYQVASILNLVGMTVAFASFILIMMQVNYELGYNRHYENADRMFRVEMGSLTDGNVVFSPWLDSDLSVTEQITAVSPNVVKGCGSKWWISIIYDDKRQRFPLEDNGGCIVSESWFDLFGFQCVEGSFDRIGETNIAVISESLASRIFPDRSPIGEMLFVENQEKPLQIAAVYKDFPKNSTVKNGIYLTEPDSKNKNSTNAKYYVAVDDVRNKEKIETALTRKAREIYDDTSFRIRLTPLREIYFSTDCPSDVGIDKGNKTTTYSLIAIAVLILGIAMINSVNFAIALIPIRIRSLNTRKVFGCRTSRLRLGLLIENAGMTLAAFLLALVLAYTLTPALANFFSGDISLSANGGVIWFSAAVTLALGILTGLYPAFYSTSFNPAFVIKGDFSHSHAGKRLRKSLVAIQFVISIALIPAALTIHAQTRFMINRDPGFRQQNILTTTVTGRTYVQSKAYIERLTSYPEIEEVAFGFQSIAQIIPAMSREADYKGNTAQFYLHIVSPNLISLLGLKIVEGRTSSESDNMRENGVFIVNQTAQKKYDLEVGTPLSTETEPGEIIGIVQDFNFQPLHYPITPMAFYVAGKARCFWLRTVYIKVNGGDIATAMKHIRETGTEFDIRNGDQDIVFMDQAVGQLYQKERNFSMLITLFCLLSVLISMIGVFGLVLFETRHRRKEIGIRKVHGATVWEIMGMFNKTYIRTVLVCFVIAAPIAYFAIRKWLEQFSYRIPIGIGAFLAALLIVLLIVVATISLQCYKTASANPVDSIKKE